MQYLLIAQAQSEFSTVWLLTKEQLFEFFGPDEKLYLEAVLAGFDGGSGGKVAHYTTVAGTRYRITIPVLPFYMQPGFESSPKE